MDKLSDSSVSDLLVPIILPYIELQTGQSISVIMYPGQQIILYDLLYTLLYIAQHILLD